MSENEITRRDFLGLAWGAAATLVTLEMVMAGLRFLSPPKVAGEFGGQFNLGLPDRYPPGSVTPVEAGRFYLVRLQDGGMLAVYRRCTHLGCAVPYDPSVGRFVCPCHGSEFTMEGDVLNAPAPRPLDLFELTVNEAGEILVDTGRAIERDRLEPAHIVYA